jgi:predicted nucleic acid-binding protein
VAATKSSAVHLFIDTNVFLNFFAYTKDDLQQLGKLLDLLRLKKAKLYLTQQVVDEFYRNRETKLSESFQKFSQYSVTGVPSFMLPLDEYKEFERQLGYSKDSHSKLIQRAKEAAESNKLPADELFGTLKLIAGVIPHGDDHYAAASRRFHLGNPPGKADSMEINLIGKSF